MKLKKSLIPLTIVTAFVGGMAFNHFGEHGATQTETRILDLGAKSNDGVKRTPKTKVIDLKGFTV